MATKKKNYNPLFEAVLSSDEEYLSADDIATLQAEADGEEAPTPSSDGSEADDGDHETPELSVEKVPAEADGEVEVPAAKADVTEEKPKKKLTPAQERIQELIRERNETEKAKESIQQQLAEQREKWARLEERQRFIKEQEERQQLEALAAEQARIRGQDRPDPQLDPQGADLWDAKEQLRNQRAEMEALRQQMAAGFQQTHAQNEVTRFTTALTADLRAFQASHPEYMEAAKYATDARVELWRRVGKSEQEARDLTNQEALAIAKQALDVGQSPAQIYFDLAKQWGWQQSPASAANVITGGVSAKDKLAQIAAGQKRAGFGNRVNAETAGDFDIENMTPAEFADMSEEKFLRLQADPAQRAKLQRWVAKHELG